MLGRLWCLRNDRFRSILAANVAVSISISIFLAPIISDGRMYRRRIDIAMFILSIGTISASHNWTTEVARVGVNRRYCHAAGFLHGRLITQGVRHAAAPVRLEQGLSGWERHPNGTHVTHVRSLTDRQQTSGGDLVTQWWTATLCEVRITES